MDNTEKTNYISVEMFNNGIQELKAEIQKNNIEIRVLQSDTAHLQTSVYWGFAIMALVITIAIFFKCVKTEKKQNLTENQVIEVRNLVRDEYAKLKAGNYNYLS